MGGEDLIIGLTGLAIGVWAMGFLIVGIRIAETIWRVLKHDKTS